MCRCNGRGVCNLRHGLAIVLFSVIRLRLVVGGVSILSESISILLFVESVKPLERLTALPMGDSRESTLFDWVADFGERGSTADVGE